MSFQPMFIGKMPDATKGGAKAAPTFLFCALLCFLSFHYRFAQQVFDLPIYTAQLAGGPFFEIAP
jgi:hypothetical protein